MFENDFRVHGGCFVWSVREISTTSTARIRRAAIYPASTDLEIFRDLRGEVVCVLNSPCYLQLENELSRRESNICCVRMNPE
jgi:hypothetical protein